jgi:hypothetical protein
MSNKIDDFNTSNITVLKAPDSIHERTLTHLSSYSQKWSKLQSIIFTKQTWTLS